MSFAIALSDEGWELVADLFDPPRRRGASATIPRLAIVEGPTSSLEVVLAAGQGLLQPDDRCQECHESVTRGSPQTPT